MSSGAGAPAVVCVLGTSRSGSSLTTRLLSLAGVYLGPEEELLQKDLHQLAGEGEAVLARAREANPEGFFEHYRITRLNERILRAMGGNWREPPALPEGWEESEALAAEREDARALLDRSFAGRSLWGWKDPRNSLTLPFWQSLIPDLRYVICLRNPIDVASSLRKRDRISLEQGLDLWLAYVAGALINTSGQPRLLAPYEAYFEDLDDAAARLARFVDREGALDGTVADALSEAVDERLWRHRTALGDVVGDGSLPRDVVSLHLLTELLAAAPADGEGRAADLQAAVDRHARELLDRRALSAAL